MNLFLSIFFAVTLWVQVPQWSDDWSNCAVDVPDASCHWYIVDADNTFGEGFDWETAPWYSVEGLLDIANLHDEAVLAGMGDYIEVWNSEIWLVIREECERDVAVDEWKEVGI